MGKEYLPIADLPEDTTAKAIGLRKVSNGCIAWLVDGAGNEYRPPLWLLNLLNAAEATGYLRAKSDIRRIIGCDTPTDPMPRVTPAELR